jgi:hypothetical protein
MKPLNFDNSPCTPTSSNCVIWAGPDLNCINLCRGDSITDVIEKLATELCTILDTLNINSYDLDCFNLVSCAPSTFTDLINFLILKVCELENIPLVPDVPPSNGCPTDCIVSVAPCFVSGSITTMNLTEYVIAIGEKICALIDANALQDIAIGDLEIRVTNLENTSPPSYTTPTFTLGCTIDTLPSGSTQAIDLILQSFINDIWCTYVSTTGDAGCLATAIANQTVASTDLSIANPLAQMSVQYAGLWSTQLPTPTVAGTINNIWACIEDLRNGSVTVSALDTATINMTVTGGPAYIVSADVIPSAPSVANTATVALSVGVGPTFTLTADAIVPGAMLAESTPLNLPLEVPSSSINLTGDGVVQLLTEIYDEDSAYDPITGIWSCPATGRYNLNFCVHLSKPAVGFTSGMVIAGIVSSTSVNYYVVSSATFNQVTQFADITGTALGLNLTVGAQLQLNILNLSDVAYTSTVGDFAKFSIQKIK